MIAKWNVENYIIPIKCTVFSFVTCSQAARMAISAAVKSIILFITHNETFVACVNEEVVSRP